MLSLLLFPPAASSATAEDAAAPIELFKSKDSSQVLRFLERAAGTGGGGGGGAW